MEKKASSGGSTGGNYKFQPKDNAYSSVARTPYRLSSQAAATTSNDYYYSADRKPLGISSGAVEPQKEIVSSGGIEPAALEAERTEVALGQLVHIARILNVEIPVNASIDTVQAALAQQKYAEASSMEIDGEQFGFSELTDEALLMADEMLKKMYDLPEKISERTIRLAHQRVKALEDYAESTLL